MRTDAILVWKDGKVILEKYARGYNAEKKHYLWSISKSISATLIGVALQAEKLRLDDPLSKFFPTLEGQKSEITLAHLMQWSSGLRWQETYEEDGDRTKSSPGQMLYFRGAKDAMKYTLDLPMMAPPGELYRYSTGDSTLLTGILQAIWRNRDFPWTSLFNKLDMKDVTFETDLKGQLLGGSSCYMKARDLLKIGQLYLSKGRWNGEQLLPEDFISYVWSPNTAYIPKTTSRFYPGRQWWLNKKPMDASKANWPAPIDTIFALGHWGQTLTIIPSENVIAVRFAHDLKREKKAGQLKFYDEYLTRLMNFVRDKR